MNISSVKVTMSSVQYLRYFINERLTAAAEEIFTEFEKTIVQYEEEIDRQRRMLDITWKPKITLQTTDLPQQHVCKEDKVLTDKQVNNQETISSLDSKPPQIKEEQEKLCNSLDRQQLVPKQETHAIMLVQCKSKCKEFSREIFRVFEKTIVQYEERFNRQRRLLDIIWKPEIKLQSIELPQQHVCMEKEVLTEQLSEEMNSSVDHKDSKPPWIKEEPEDLCTSLFQEDTELPQIKEEQEILYTSAFLNHSDAPAIKEEQEELCTSQEGEQLLLKQETDSFTVTSTYEESDHSEPEQNSDQLFSHNSPVKLKQNRRNSSHSKNVDNSAISESQCNTDTGKKSVKCGICGKTFKFMCYLKKHHLSHTGEKPYTCETCGTCFSRSGSLKLHMVTHTGEKPYPCDICGKSFTLSRSLKIHMRLHTGEKPYPCETCGKSFTLSHSLKIHMRIHTGEKPYACEKCGKSFIHSAHLKVHITSHTGEKPHSCATCGKRFSHQSAVRRHIRIHTGEKPYSCKSCGKSFRQSGILLRHMRTHKDKSQS